MNQPRSVQARSVTSVAPLVTLRRGTPDDAATILRWRAESAVRRYQPIRQMGVDEVRVRLTEMAARVVDNRLDGDVQWIIEVGQPVGWVTLKDIDRCHRSGAIGYTVGAQYHGRGIATAAVKAVLPLAFDTGDLARLEAIATVDNRASRRVLENAGFRLEGIARGLLIIDGVRVDHTRYGLLRSDWEAIDGAMVNGD